jgi:hypothetical protein
MPSRMCAARFRWRAPPDPDSGDSQFFICFDDARFLDNQYTVWGKVTSGMENVDKIKRGEPVKNPDKIVSAKMVTRLITRRSCAGLGPRILEMRETFYENRPVRFRPSADAIALRPAEPRDSQSCLSCGPDAAGTRRPPRCLRSSVAAPKRRSCSSSTTPKSFQRVLIGTRERNGVPSKIEATLLKRLSPGTLAGAGEARASVYRGDRIRFGHESRVCLLGALDATVEDKGEGGEITLGFDFHGAVLDEAIDALGHIPLPPYIAVEARRRRCATARTIRPCSRA